MPLFLDRCHTTPVNTRAPFPVSLHQPTITNNEVNETSKNTRTGHVVPNHVYSTVSFICGNFVGRQADF